MGPGEAGGKKTSQRRMSVCSAPGPGAVKGMVTIKQENSVSFLGDKTSL